MILQGDCKNLPSEADVSRPISWCPTLDLIAIFNTDGAVWIFRANGQRVWTLTVDGSRITNICWRPDGKAIAACTDEGKCYLYDVDTGNLAICIDGSSADGPVRHLSWNSRKGFYKSSRFGPLNKISLLEAVPKISAPPQISAEGIYRTKVISGSSSVCEDSPIDMLMWISNKAHMGIYGLLSLEGSPLPEGSCVGCFSSADLSEHYLVLDDESVKVLKARTNFVNDDTFSQVALMCTKVNASVEFLTECVNILKQECKPFLDFSTRLVNLLEEEVDGLENVSNHFQALLYTGVASDPLLEWLRDVLGERNITRWSQLSSECYTLIRKIFFHSINPCVESLILVLSRLQSYAHTTQGLGLVPESISLCLQSASQLMEHFHSFISKLNEEQMLFESFFNWLALTLEELLIDDDDDRSPAIKDKLSSFPVGEITAFLERKFQSSISKMTGGASFILMRLKSRGNSATGDVKKAVSTQIGGFHELVEIHKKLTTSVQAVMVEDHLCLVQADETTLTIFRISSSGEIESKTILQDDVVDFCLSSNKIVVLTHNAVCVISITGEQVQKLTLNSDLKPDKITTRGERVCLLSQEEKKYVIASIN